MKEPNRRHRLTIVRSWETRRVDWRTRLVAPAAASAVVHGSVLVGIALTWIRLRRLPLEMGTPLRDSLIAIGAAAAIAAINYVIIRMGRPIWPARALRTHYCEVLRPRFGSLRPLDIVIIAISVGCGEELLFRGAMQPEFGLVPTAIIFGALHSTRKGTPAYGVWAAFMGLGLGWLAQATAGLIAPIVGHVVYDAAALAYVRLSGERSSGPRR